MVVVRRNKLLKRRFGKLKPIRISHKSKSGDIIWLCQCSCGNKEVYVTTSNLNLGKQISCGCAKKEGTKQPTFKNISKKIFGKWKVIKYDQKKSLWLCKCDCGNDGYVNSYSLTSGLSKSCGCNRLSDLTDEFIKQKLINYFKNKKKLPKGKEIPKVLGLNVSHNTLDARISKISSGYRNFIIEHKLDATVSKDYFVDRNYFSKINSSDKAYFLGWLYTDGNLKKGKKEGFGTVSLDITDKSIVESFKKYTKSEKSIYTIKRPGFKTSYSLHFNNPKIWKDCINLGLTPKKTHTIKFPKLLPKKYYRDFLRGVFEGDGTVAYGEKTQSKIVAIYCANEKFLINIQNKILKPNKILSKYRYVPSHNLYTLRISAKDFINFYDLIYLNIKNDQILKRKKDKFFEIVNKSKRIKKALTKKQIIYFGL